MILAKVKTAIKILEDAGFQAYLVGGCVRDLLLALRSSSEGGREIKPGDWDIAVNAKPEEIERIFSKEGYKTFYENKFGTVTVLMEAKKLKAESCLEVEITPFRIESKYSDKRHPDKIEWAKTIEDDLARRDFTVNAMAIKAQSSKRKAQNHISKLKTLENIEVIDPFNGQGDLEAKLIRAVGRPAERFEEDALRLIRAIRFAVQLGEGWKIEAKTLEAIKEKARFIEFVSQERIRDELIKIVMTERAKEGMDLLKDTGLLRHILPELEESIGVGQNKHHIYDCYEHAARSLDFAAKKGFALEVRLAALFHDIGKPRTKEGEGPNSTFYNHEVVGAKMTKAILRRLHFPAKEVEKITKLVRYHLFYYNVDEVGESSVRRLVRKAGPENMEELLQLRQADRIGSGVPKAEPYKLRHLRYMIEKVSKDPILPKMLKISGNDVMDILKIQPGPKVGQILDILLGQTLDDSKKNKADYLKSEIKRLGGMSDEEIAGLAKKARQEREEIETKKDEMTKKKYWVT